MKVRLGGDVSNSDRRSYRDQLENDCCCAWLAWIKPRDQRSIGCYAGQRTNAC